MTYDPRLKRPPPPPSQPSEYDGHDDYRQRFAPKPFATTLQDVLPVPFIFAMWFVGGVFSYALFVGDNHEMTGTARFVAGVFCWLIPGSVVAIVYAVVVHKVRDRPLLWLGCLALAALLAVAAFANW